MTDVEKREAARMLFYKWKDRGKEDEDDRSYWIDIMQDLMGVDHVTDKLEFQKKVVGLDGNTKRIDVYIPSTKVLIEQKSLNIALDKPQSGHNGMTPYEQAKMYDNSLPHSEKARWIILSNFREIWIYDMDERVPEPTKIEISNLQTQYTILESVLIAKEKKTVTKEMEISLKAGELVGKIHEKLQEQYMDPSSDDAQRSLNILCVRLVFCLYAEDAGLFGERDAFSSYIEQYDPKDIRRVLIDLFKVLDTPIDKRADLYFEDDLLAFPYVNGGLFKDEDIIIPKFTEGIKDAIIASAKFDWSEISPTIFGAVFESTLNPETRRKGGMHYTSIENIHKVIDPLFLDDLTKELDGICDIQVEKNRKNKLLAFQSKLAMLKFFDPACGSGNFLTETYISIRRLENRMLKEYFRGQMVFGEVEPIQVTISQFYGIEINDFAVTVAKTALWIAESQMMKETEDVVHMNLDFLPLKTNAYIVEGNSLRIDWDEIIPKNELSYIMGNPPFSAGRRMGESQRDDMNLVASDFPKNGELDYVSLWYIKAARYMACTKIRAGFVSTSSIVQGEQVILLWKILFEKYNLDIFYAIRSFNWESEASSKAGVHCIIILFTITNLVTSKYIVDGDNKTIASHINGYLMDSEDLWVEGQKKAICNVPAISNGSKPLDNAICAFSPEEKESFIAAEPLSAPYFYKYMGSREFINNIERWFLLINRIPPHELSQMPYVRQKLKEIREYRLSSNSAQTIKLAETPAKFHFENMPTKEYLVIPQTSSGRRRYIPIGFLTPDVMVNNKLQVMTEGGLYEFGILSSNIHNAWLRTVAGRLREDFTYSVSVVYNTFPWPEPTAEQKQKIEETAQMILDARNLYPEASLADLYLVDADGLEYMPDELRQAHKANNVAVMKAYGFSVKDMSESDCVAKLMKMYQELTK